MLRGSLELLIAFASRSLWLLRFRQMATFLIACFCLSLSTSAWADDPAYRVLSTNPAPIHQLTALAVSKDGKFVATGTLYGEVQIWDWRSAKMVSSRKIDEESVEHLFFMDDDKRLAALYFGGDIGIQHMFVWETATGAVSDEGKIESYGAGYAMPDGTVAMESGANIAFLDRMGKPTNRSIEITDGINHLAISPDGQYIAGGGREAHYKEVVILGAQGKLLRAVDRGFQPFDTVFSPDSKTVAVLQQENTGYTDPADFNPKTNGYDLLDVQTGKKLQRFGGHKLYLSGAQFSPDGSRFLTWSGDKTLILWDVKSGKKIHDLEGHRASVAEARFIGDGLLVVSVSKDGSMRFWSASDGREIASVHVLAKEKETDPPSYVVIQPDGHFLESGPATLEIIRMNGDEDGAALTQDERKALKLQEFQIMADAVK